MQRLFHDDQHLGILSAVHEDDAGQVEAEAAKAGRVKVGLACGPQRDAASRAQMSGQHGRRETCHRWRKFGFERVRGELMQRAERKAATGQWRIQPRIREGQHGTRLSVVEIVAFDGADLHPERVQSTGSRRPGTPV